MTEKEKAIKKEINRLSKILVDVDENRKSVMQGLIEESAFMRVTLKQLKEEIDEKGPIDEMPQGDYTILREHPALKSYNTMIQRYNSVVKEVINLLPKADIKSLDDEFDIFLSAK